MFYPYYVLFFQSLLQENDQNRIFCIIFCSDVINSKKKDVDDCQSLICIPV